VRTSVADLRTEATACKEPLATPFLDGEIGVAPGIAGFAVGGSYPKKLEN
jgi:hypothetical protein